MKKTAIVLFLLMLAALPFDHAIAKACLGLSPAILQVFRFITHWGESQYILIPAALVLFYCWKKPKLERPFIISMHVFALVATTGILIQIPKFIFGRARPKALWSQGLDGLHWFTRDPAFASFPSGHTATAAAFAFAIGAFFPRARPALFAYVALVALSRIVLQQHYTSDVLGGALAACLVTFALAKRLPMRV